MVVLLVALMLGLSGCKASEVDARTYANKNSNVNGNSNGNVNINSNIDFDTDVDIKANFDANIDIDIGADIKANLDILTRLFWDDDDRKEEKSKSDRERYDNKKTRKQNKVKEKLNNEKERISKKIPESNTRKRITVKKPSNEKERIVKKIQRGNTRIVGKRKRKEDRRKDDLSDSGHNTNTNTGSGRAYNTNRNTGSGRAYNTNRNTGAGRAYNTNRNTGSGRAYNTNRNTGAGSAYNTNRNTGAGSAYNTNGDTNIGAAGSAYNTNGDTSGGSAYNTNGDTSGGSAYNTNSDTGGGSAYNTNSDTGANTNTNGDTGSGSGSGYALSPEVGKLFRLRISNFKDQVTLWAEDKDGNRVDALLRLGGSLSMTIEAGVAEFTKLFLVERSKQHVLVVQKEPETRRVALHGNESTVTWTLERHGAKLILDVISGLTEDGNVGVKLHIVTVKGDAVNMNGDYGINMRVAGGAGTATFALQTEDDTLSFATGCYRWVAETMDRALFSTEFGGKCGM